MESTREADRTRMAREIHDEFGQTCTALKIDISWLKRYLLNPNDTVHQRVDSMIDLIDQTIHRVRQFATELRPGLLDDLGLSAALEWQAQQFSERTGIRHQLQLTDDCEISDKKATAVFRIFQEILTNVMRHAEATQVVVELICTSETIQLTVRDNGRGIHDHEIHNPRSLGLLGMRERAYTIGGEIKFQRLATGGTKVELSAPS